MKNKPNQNNKPSIKKILLMGLANSGKTSILMCLRGIKNLESFTTLNPTKGLKMVPFETLGSEFSLWDFGGQETYLNDHLKQFNKHVIGAKKIIYVIDVQDVRNYDTSLEFFKKVLDLLVKLGIDIDISVFLHKFDPDLDEQKVELDNDVISGLTQKIDELIPAQFEYKIFKTSISTLFQKQGIE